MNRVLMLIRDQHATLLSATDRHLLDRFLIARDESAFAELVRRYGPVVWGACCRRLGNVQDAEDAFQATFLVLLRRATRLTGDAPIGPWLYRVAAMTSRNVVRSNKRRTAITGPMEHDVPETERDSAAKLDIDAALLALPERDRVAVVLCHLQGLSRREAAERIGCPEGTLSARLNRALQRLRTHLGGGTAAALAGGTIVLPVGLASATVRSASVYSTSTLTVAGVSSAVVGLTNGVLRMFWMKKVMTTAMVAILVLGVGVLGLGITGRSESIVQATEPPGSNPIAPQEPDALKRLEKQLHDLEKQKQLLDTTLNELRAEKQKLEDTKRNKEEIAAMGADIVIIVNGGEKKPQYAVREVVDGKVGEMRCSDLSTLAMYLIRAFNSPDGPKKLRVSAISDISADQVTRVFTACAKAGYAKATFTQDVVKYAVHEPLQVTRVYNKLVEVDRLVPKIKPGEIDLTKYAKPQRP